MLSLVTLLVLLNFDSACITQISFKEFKAILIVNKDEIKIFQFHQKIFFLKLTVCPTHLEHKRESIEHR